MLPFLKRKDSQIAGIVVKHREPDQTVETNEENDPRAAMKACARDLLRAMEAKDIDGLVDAIQAMFEIADSQPHVEGSHVEPHSYDAQNEKAAKK